MKTLWNLELAKELESVLKGGQHEVPAVTIENLIGHLKSDEVDVNQTIARLREYKLNWFADRLANNEFHNRFGG